MKRTLKAQFLIGLFSGFTYCSAQVDSGYWNELNRQNNAVYDLMYEDLDSALYESNRIIELAKKPLDTLVYSKLLMYNGHILADQGKFSRANLQYLQVLQLREKLADKSLVSSAYHSIANMNYYLQEYEETVSYTKKAIESYRLNPKCFREVANCYNLIGVTFYDRADYDSAISNYQRGIGILDENADSKPIDYAVLNDNLGNSLIWKGKYKDGLPYLKNNIKVYLKARNLSNLIWVYTQLVNTYIKLEKLDSAQHYLNLTSNIPKSAFSLEKYKDLLYFKSLVAIEKLEFDSLDAFISEFYSLSDSLVTEKTNANIKDAQTKYEVEKKEAALKLSEEESAKLSAENKAKNRLLLLGLAVFIIIVLVAIYLYRNFKQKEKVNALEVEVKNAELDELLSNQESKIYASILEGQERERERIAQDLHDRLGGTLAALKLSLRKPQYKIEEGDLSIIDNAVNEVRSIAHNLSTGLVHKYGLNEAVNQLFRTLENSKGIKFSLYLHPDIGTLGQTMGIELYRIVQELVSNTLKHSKADEVSLQTNFTEGIFNLIYEDNGIGFDPKELKGGIGLENVKGRAERIGGELNIDAAKGRGSIFIVELKKTADVAKG
ncbi:MAG: two-component system NarL family sensor kinase [Vicingaceae bacterium]|jgi:two-component system NarL family sensor kinase